MSRARTPPRAPAPRTAAARPRAQARLRTVQQAIAALGLFRRGTLTPVYGRCGKPRCRCAQDPAQRHGPYVQWTRKVAGKTVTARVRAADVPLFEEWIANARRLDGLLAEWQALSLRLTEERLQAGSAGRERAAGRRSPRRLVG